MRVKIGTFCMLLGTALLCGALSLFLFNRNQELSAEESVQSILPQVIEQIRQPDPTDSTETAQVWIPKDFLEPEDLHMTEVEIDGNSYIGYLSIPNFELELPVMADWNYDKLKIAPCRYAGTLKGENLVVMAHNYARHFGRLSDLKPGDLVVFTDMDGYVVRYQVTATDVLPPNAVEEVTSGTADLTLFTCTFGGKSRVTVYCDRMKAEME